MRKLIAIMSCHAKRSWVDAQRQTWVKDVVSSGYAVVKFFYGAPKTAFSAYAMEDDEVWLGGDDSYAGIPLKVQGICRYAVDHCYDYVAKCDDDVYAVPGRFPSLPLTAGYIGRFRSPYGKVYPVHFASGFWYWLDNRCAKIVADTPWNGDWQDERFVATALARHGIGGYMDSINYMVSGPSLVGAAVLNHDIFRHGTVFCEYGPKDMHAMHLAMRHLNPVANHPGLMRQHLPIVTEEILRSKPTDKIPPHKLNRRY